MAATTNDVPTGVASVLNEARQAYVAIETDHGPHVTPELYTWSDDRLWFATATSTLKARVLEDGAHVGVAVVGRGASVILEGTVDVFDPRHPLALATSHPPQLMRAVASFGARNGSDLVGFALDALKGATERRVPNMRLLVAVDPARVALVENDRVSWHEGFSRAPDEATGDVPAGGEVAVAAFDGRRVAPARWFAEDAKVFVPPAVLDLIGVEARGHIGVVVDSYNGPGPAAKQGALVRGDFTRDGDSGWIAVDAARTVEWDGTEMSRHDHTPRA